MPVRESNRLKLTTPLDKVIGSFAVRKQNALDAMLKVGIAIIAMIVAYVCALLASRIVRNAVDQYIKGIKNNRNPSDKDIQLGNRKRMSIIFDMVGTFTFWLVLLSLMILIFSLVGIRTAAIATLFGSVFVSIGLGLQGTLSDIASGVVLLTANTYTIGDYIEVENTKIQGKVTAFNVLFTRLHDSATNSQVIVPNRVLYGNTVKNYSINPLVVDEINIAIANSNDDEQLRRILSTVIEEVNKHPEITKAARISEQVGTKEPVVTCEVSIIGPFATVLQVRFRMTVDAYITETTINVQHQITTIARQAVLMAGGRLSSPMGPNVVATSSVSPALQDRKI